MAQILSGRAVAERWQALLATRVDRLVAGGCRPGLVFVRVGEDPASVAYVRGKEKACRGLGLESRTVVLPADSPPATLEREIDALNQDSSVDGFIVQLPLPAHLSEAGATQRVSPEKDIDAFHPLNQGLLLQGRPRFLPPTPAGIVRILEEYEIPTCGRHVVIVGRSTIVGRPLSVMLSMKGPRGNATVTVCHTGTPDLAAFTRAADILVVAAGRPRLIGAEMVAPGAVVIDVGIHREPDPDRPGKERLCGDVDFAAVEGRVAAITPVPGGVGPTTVMALIENAVQAAERRRP